MVDFMALARPYVKNVNDRTFREHFGVSAVVAGAIWHFILDNITVDIDWNTACKEKHLLWWLHFVKTYGTVGACSNFCNATVNTWRNWVEHVEILVANLDVVSSYDPKYHVVRLMLLLH